MDAWRVLFHYSLHLYKLGTTFSTIMQFDLAQLNSYICRLFWPTNCCTDEVKALFNSTYLSFCIFNGQFMQPLSVAVGTSIPKMTENRCNGKLSSKLVFSLLTVRRSSVEKLILLLIIQTLSYLGRNHTLGQLQYGQLQSQWSCIFQQRWNSCQWQGTYNSGFQYYFGTKCSYPWSICHTG